MLMIFDIEGHPSNFLKSKNSTKYIKIHLASDNPVLHTSFEGVLKRKFQNNLVEKELFLKNMVYHKIR